ncbi:hypothetical protein EN904_05190 [Mesorhizobium sp. M7A.F.Ca.CA.001.07.2.1]|uniref:hypothetical protein n=2 Tax=Phyllobacteriaceae TaxID=69277 RepID=UPI000FCA99BD|nr:MULTISPECIES: hypothetical protein [Mesorhizobium]RVB45123.1 hypothetical protein EN918_05070 [Mesorhizobium sp. M7A.F.Ca.CA.004.05.1.1]MCF6126252.1 hypothetical protein [Mesorhizobium ciceri]MCQ8816264.1 hypothetical protein [Mesorhizobium sp. SEMIA396]RUX80647.1 hypothetical protein EN982_32975 [Mesorhizobium sp. M7A.F.Ca.CA.004.08.1.1]RUX82346.1 hypothetical protein EN983_01280 [Mesorhizobium sp. M7A.F.Ca.CA.004.08.2.1]
MAATVALNQVSANLWEMPQPLGDYAGELLKRGRSYYQAFQILAERNEPGLSYPAYFLLAHAVEVILKSYLVAKGTPKSKLGKRPLRHDTGQVFAECEKQGLVVADQMMKALAIQLAHVNQDYDLRYPTGFNLSIPGPKHCVLPLDALIAAVAPGVEKAFIIAQIQFAADTQHLRGSKIRWSD